MKLRPGKAVRFSAVALIAALILSAAAVSPRTAFSQGANSINGTVFDPNRRPVGDLWLELLDEVNTILGRTRADSNGRYVFRGLSSGVFMVRVVTFGTQWAPQTQRVELIQALASGGGRAFAEHLDFHLKPADAAPAGPIPGTIFAQEVPEAARKAYDEGVALLGSDADSGIAKLNAAVEAFPTYFQALERLGIEYVKLGRHEPALPVLAKALEVNPAAQDSLYTLGVAQYRLKRYPESAASLKKMIGMGPAAGNLPFAHYFLGLALLRSGNSADAEPELKKAYSLGGKSIPSDVHMALAQIYSTRKDYKDAVRELELFVKEDPQAPDAAKVKSIIEQLKKKI